jgi:hypothetical protein
MRMVGAMNKKDVQVFLSWLQEQRYGGSQRILKHDAIRVMIRQSMADARNLFVYHATPQRRNFIIP